ncbi:MAG: class I SAM-dependent methyltransferase [Phycisphaerae bacterium]|nr:class I SAM-dependent methyltransferase [Phycisphaerae bacterium]
MNRVLHQESDDSVGSLERRLLEFYCTTSDYQSFNDPTPKDDFWAPIRADIASRVAAGKPCTALEFGAGCTVFGEFLGDLRPRVRFEVHDVTDRHKDFLSRQADASHFGDLRDIPGTFDVVFSTFVWEHVCRPAQTYERLLRMLAPGGSLFIICPRYDLPIYTPPSARHYGRLRRWVINLRALLMRVGFMLRGRPAFLIHTDPAVLSVKWYRDADAIHWVSLADFHRATPCGFKIRYHRVRRQGLIGRFWARWLLTFVEIRRDT